MPSTVPVLGTARGFPFWVPPAVPVLGTSRGSRSGYPPAVPAPAAARGRRVVRVNGADVVLNGLTISGGRGTFGAGLLLCRCQHGGDRLYLHQQHGHWLQIDGGGAYFTAAGATLTDCAFTGNDGHARPAAGHIFEGAGDHAHGRYLHRQYGWQPGGGGAYFNEAATLQNCVFANNTAADSDRRRAVPERRWHGYQLDPLRATRRPSSNGGGIYVRYTAGGDFNLQNSLLLGNTAMDDASGHQLYINNTDAANVAALQHNLFESSTGIVYATPGAAGITEANTVDPTDADAVFASTMANDNDYLRLKEGSTSRECRQQRLCEQCHAPHHHRCLQGAMRIQIGTVDLGAYESTFKTAQTIDFTLVATAPAGDAIDSGRHRGRLWFAGEFCQFR